MSNKENIHIPQSDINDWNSYFSKNFGNDTSLLTKSLIPSIMKNTHLLCIITDEKGMIQLFNPGAESILGYKSDEVISHLNITEICDKQSLIERAETLSKEIKTKVDPNINALVLKALKEKEDQFTLGFVSRDNSSLLFDLSVSVIKDSIRKTSGYLIIGTENDSVHISEYLDKEIDKKIIKYIENAPLGIFVVDNDGNYILVNKVACEISGYSKNEILRTNPKQPLYLNDPDNSVESFRKLLASGQAIVETRFITKKGNERFWRVNIIKIQGNRYMGFVNDITDQKLAQNELEKINKYLETIVENSPNMLFLKDAKDLTFVQFNKAGEELTGYSREEMLGKNDFDFFPKEQAEFFRDKDREVLEGENPIYIEEELIQTRYKGGRILHTKKVPVFDTQGRPEYLLGLSEDITDQKNAEREYLQRKIDLDNFFRLSPDFLCIANLDFTFARLNSVWEQLLGFSTEETLKLNFLDLIHPDEVEETKVALSTLTTEQPLTNYQIRLRCCDSTYIWIEWHFVLTGDQIYAIGRDITKKIYYEGELKKSKDTAEAASRAKSDFLANMSHEIRNPLNAIIGFAELLHNNIKDEKLLSQVSSIRNSGKALLGILNDILDLSKIEAGKMKLKLEPVDLNFLIKDIENMFSQKIHEKGLSFCVEKDHDLTYKLMLDEVRFRQILFNIIGNAVKFTEKGYICLYLNKVYKDENHIDLAISIEDTGIGIPKEQHQLIFETFQQQDGQSTKKFGGTGLGLAISKKLAEMMGGKIAVISEPEKGSIFKLIIPDVKIKHEETKMTENVFDPYSIVFDHSTVLIVDDSELNLSLMTMTLENSNLKLITARNGKEAIELARRNHPDIILMDLKMPLMNGYEATRIIRKELGATSIPVIAISASTDLESKAHKTNVNFDGYLVKPIRLDDLFDILKRFLSFHIIEIEPPVAKVEEDVLNFTDEQRQHLREIVRILETDFLPINESVIKKQLMEQIDFFGKGLVLFGEANSLSIIIEYGNKICQHVDNFEIDKMMKTLKSFPEIIEKIKSLARLEASG